MRPSLASVMLAAALALAPVATPVEARAAPAGLSERPLDLELKQADVKAVYALLAEVSGRRVDLDPCVQGTVDIRLKNTPIPMVFDALASKLQLFYEDQGSAILVRCAGDAGGGDPRLATRVTLSLREAPLDAVLDVLVRAGKLDGVEWRLDSTVRSSLPKVTVTIENVRVATALAVLSDASGLRISVARGKIVVAN